jgi:hypothetical protein
MRSIKIITCNTTIGAYCAQGSSMELTPTTIMHAYDSDRQVTTKQNIQTHLIQVVTHMLTL